MSEYFHVSTDYLLKGIEHNLSEKTNKGDLLNKISTCINYIGLIILFFDMYSTWNIEADFMSNQMMFTKIIIIVCLLIGITLFMMSGKITYKRLRRHLMINIFAYAGLGSILAYLFIMSSVFWGLIVYAIIVLVTELFFIKKSRFILTGRREKCVGRNCSCFFSCRIGY